MNELFFERYSRIDSPLHRLDPRVKVFAHFFLIVLCVTTPNDSWSSYAGYFILLVSLAIASRVPVGFIITRFSALLPFVLLVGILLPFMDAEYGVVVFRNIVVKSATALLALILLVSTTPFSSMLGSLRQFGVPPLFISVTALAYRYIFLLTGEAARMRQAAASRSWNGRWLWQSGTVGKLAASLLLRSFERAEMVYNAILARGSGLMYAHTANRKLAIPDIMFAVAVPSIATFFRLSA